MLPVFQNIDKGILTFHDLWQPQNNHRLFFSRLVMAISAYATNWNTKVEMLLSFCLCVISLFLIYLLVKDGIKHRLLALIMMFLSAFWLFSPVQSENWLWGLGIIWFLCATTSIATLYFITRMGNKRSNLLLTLAVASAVISTYAFGWGQAIWPIGLLLLLAQKQHKKVLIIWSVSAIIAFAGYYFNFDYNGPPLPVLGFLHHPINSICYFFVMFGRPFTNHLYPAMMLGAISLLLLVPALLFTWERREQLNKFLPWLGMILFSLVGAFMIILGRMNHDFNIPTSLTDALQPRYTAITLLYIIGLSGLIFSLVDGFKLTKKVLQYFLILVLVVQIPLIYSSYWVGSRTSVERYELMKRLQLCSFEPTELVTQDCLSSNNYLNTNDVAREHLQFLKDKNWAGY